MNLEESYPKTSLRAARVNANLSQSEAAKLIGVCTSTLQNYENGITVPNWDTVDAIARAYNFPVSFIDFTQQLA